MQALRSGRLLSHDDLKEAVAREVRATPQTHQELGDTLMVTRHAVSNAVTQSGPGVFKLQVRLLELLTPYTLDKPTFRVIRKPDTHP